MSRAALGLDGRGRPSPHSCPQLHNHRINRSSPTRRVTRSRSRYSSSGIAYLRLTPVISLKRATSIFGVLVLRAAILWRRSESALWWKTSSSEILIRTLSRRSRVTIFCGADFIYLQTRQHFFQRRNFQACGSKRLLDDLLGLGFFVFHDHAAAGQVDEFAGGFQFLFFRQFCQHAVEHLRAQVDPIAQLFFAHPRHKRIRIMKVLESLKYICLCFRVCRRRNQHRIAPH